MPLHHHHGDTGHGNCRRVISNDLLGPVSRILGLRPISRSELIWVRVFFVC